MKLSKGGKIALITSAGVLAFGGAITGTVFITKAIVERGNNQKVSQYNVVFNGYQCHLVGENKVKSGEKYSATIATDDEDYTVTIVGVTMGDKSVPYTFISNHLSIETPATGNIEISAVGTDRSRVYATAKYEFSGSDVNVTGIDTDDLSSVTDLIIPTTVEDPATNEVKNVTTINPGAFYGLSNLKNLTIPFIGCSNSYGATSPNKKLFGIVFGNKLYEGVRTLTWQYYDDDTGSYIGAAIPSSLETVNVLNTDTTIQRAAFNNCSNIKKINIINTPNGTTLGQSMFEGCTSLEEVSYPSTVTSIGKSCFKNCSSLIQTDFSNITTIGESAFDTCTAMQKAKLPSTVTNVGVNAFANLSSAIILCQDTLAEISAKEDWSTSWLGSGSFTPVIYGNLNPTSSQDGDFQYLKVDDANAYIVAYNGSNVSTITIPEKLGNIPVTYIGPRVFEGLTKVKNVVVNAHEIKSIGSYAFEGCTALESINLKDTAVISLGTACFYGCNQLKVDDSSEPHFLPTTTEIIGNYCFYDCHHILNIDLSHVKSIGDYSLAYCCYNYVDPTTGNLVFSSTDSKGNKACLTFVKLNPALEKIGEGTFMNARELRTISIPTSSNSVFDNIPDYCFYHTKIGSQAGFTVTPTLKTIGNYSFAYCTELCKLDFQYATEVESIGEGAFYACANVQGDITLPTTLKYIGDYVFEECVSLSSINIKSTSITTLPFDFAFDCESLTSVSFAGNLEEIGDFAFGGCKSLTKFNDSTTPVLANTLHTIGNYAFSNCSSLKSLKISKCTAAGDKGINMGTNVFAGWSDDQTVILNSDLFDYYRKADTVQTKFGWTMTNRKTLFIRTDKYKCDASGSDEVIIQVE